MKLFILIIVVLALIHNISAAYNYNSAECIGGYEDPNATGTCTECPEGKASGDSSWKKSYYQDSNSCIEVPYTCGPGQVLTAYSGGYYYCGNAPKYSYCPNGKCLYDCRFGYCTGQNYCPSQYSSPASNSLKINNVQPLSNNNKISPSNSYTSTETYDPYISGTYTSTDGAVMCTTSDTAYCSPGSGFFYSGVIDMTGSTLSHPLLDAITVLLEPFSLVYLELMVLVKHAQSVQLIHSRAQEHLHVVQLVLLVMDLLVHILELP